MNKDTFLERFQKSEVKEYPNKVSSSPKVSVLIQTYQHVQFIERCLESIIHQKTDFPFEIIIGEDDSTDGTREICLNYANKYPELIKLFLHTRNNNIKVGDVETGNFNIFYNLFNAQGPYITICEGDDYWGDLNKLQTQVGFLDKNPSYILCFHRAKILSTIEKIDPKPLSHLSADLSEEDLLKGPNHPVTNTVCFRNIFPEIPKEIIKVINIDSFWFSILGLHGKGKFLPEIKHSFYRVHDGGIWSSRKEEQKIIYRIITFQKLTEYHQRNGNEELALFYKKRVKNNLKMLSYQYFINFSLISSFKTFLKFKNL